MITFDNQIYLNPDEACQKLSISRSTLYYYIRKNYLKKYRIKRKPFFLLSEIEKLLKPVFEEK